ncbi:MAG: hypothetical protein N4A45_12845 [Flavobacteriales bacterium]|jgi:antitoxin component YwqK of YwqJK toxin-antitoxin module|nr:hypothetical protein [Flavobacteriales bacterium]
MFPKLFTTLFCFSLLACQTVDNSEDLPCPEVVLSGLACKKSLDEPNIENLSGFQTFYYSDGTIKSQGNLNNGILHGFWIFKSSTGQILSEGNYTNGRLDGFWKVYWENGNLREEGHYQNCLKNGFWKFYFEEKSNAVKHEGNYQNDQKNGLWKSYDIHQNIIYNETCGE